MRGKKEAGKRGENYADDSPSFTHLLKLRSKFTHLKYPPVQGQQEH